MAATTFSPAFGGAAGYTAPLRESAPSPFELIGLRLLLVFSFFNYSRLLEVLAPWARLQLLMATLALLAAISTGKLFTTLKSSIGKSLIALSICFALSVPFSVWRGGSANILMNEWSKSFAVFLAVAPLTNRTEYALKTVYAWAFGCAVLPIVTLIVGVYIEGRITMPYGLFGNPNDLCMAMCTGVALWMSIISNSKTNMFIRLFGILALGPIMLVLMRTGSRAGLITLAVVVVSGMFSYSMATRVKWMFGAAIAFSAVMPFVSASTYNRFFTLFESETTDEVETAAVGSAESRRYLLIRSLEVTLLNPLVGVGMGMFEVADNNAAQAEGFYKGAWHGTHNTYTQISSENGIPALIAYLACLFFCWKSLRQVRAWNATLRHPDREGVAATEQALRQQLVMFMTAGCFAHFGYTMFIPNMAAVICGFYLASKREFTAVAAAQQQAPAYPQGPTGFTPQVIGPARVAGSLLPSYRRS